MKLIKRSKFNASEKKTKKKTVSIQIIKNAPAPTANINNIKTVEKSPIKKSIIKRQPIKEENKKEENKREVKKNNENKKVTVESKEEKIIKNKTDGKKVSFQSKESKEIIELQKNMIELKIEYENQIYEDEVIIAQYRSIIKGIKKKLNEKGITLNVPELEEMIINK